MLLKAIGRALAGSLVCVLPSLMAPLVFAESESHLSLKSAASKRAVFQFDSLKKIQKRADLLKNVGMKLTDLKVYLNSAGDPQYIGRWEPGSGPSLVVTYSDWDDFSEDWYGPQNTNGYVLLDIETVVIDEQLTIHAVYGHGTDIYNHWILDEVSFGANHTSAVSNGLRLVDTDIYQDGSDAIFVASYLQGTGSHATWNTDSWSSFTSQFNSLKSTMDLIDVEVTKNFDGTLQYFGTWRAGTGNGVLVSHTSWNAFKSDWAAKAESGYALLDMDVSPGSTTGSLIFVASYIPVANPPLGTFDLAVMRDSLKNIYLGNVVGMSYAISHNGQLATGGGVGLAQRTPDGNISMTSNIEHEPASVAKMLTVPLLFKLVDLDSSVNMSSKITSRLPGSWTPGPNIQYISYTDVLKHQTGFKQLLDSVSGVPPYPESWDTSWSGTMEWVENGVPNRSSPSTPHSPWYMNQNYALARILISSLWNSSVSYNGTSGPSGSLNVNASYERYLNFMNLLIANDEGIEPVECYGQSGQALSYEFAISSPPTPGVLLLPAVPDECGGDGNLKMTAQEVVKYWTAVRYNDSIMSPADRTAMKNGSIIGSRYISGAGSSYGHNGGAANMGACLWEFPNDVVAYVMTNSNKNPSSSVPADPCDALIDSYEDALAASTLQTNTFYAAAAAGGPGTAGCTGQFNCSESSWGIDINDNSGFKWTVSSNKSRQSSLLVRVASYSGTRSMGLWVNNVKIGVVTATSAQAPRGTGKEYGPFNVNLISGANTIELRDSEGSLELDALNIKVTTAGPLN